MPAARPKHPSVKTARCGTGHDVRKPTAEASELRNTQQHAEGARMTRETRADAARASVFDRLRALLDELPGLFNDRVDLLSLELRSAGLSLALMLLWMAAAAILAVTAWLGIWGAIGAALILHGWPWPGVIAGIVILNLVAAIVAVLRARSLAPRLGLPLTRRHLRFGAPEDDMPPPLAAAADLATADRVMSPQGVANAMVSPP